MSVEQPIEAATDATEISENQATAAKSYTQKEVDDMMARMRGSLEKKLLRPYADLGDPEELRSIKSDWEKRQQEQQIKRGEFEKTLQELATKKDAEIQKRDHIIREYRVNTPLLSAAAKYRAINAEQVKTLLQNHVRLNDEGEVEVIDSKGSVRYNDNGEPLQVDDLVNDFLKQNPHFVSATPATANTKTSIQPAVNANGKVDLAKLDLSRPQDRQIYREARQKGLL
jgi:hypothetical protein